MFGAVVLVGCAGTTNWFMLVWLPGPPRLAAVTTDWTEYPSSVAATTYVWLVAPLMLEHTFADVQSCHT
jgi:hypothetical protein